MTLEATAIQAQRLFVALELPDPVRSVLTSLRRHLPGVRWTAGENLHLTLRFLGSTDLEQVATIHHALKNVRANRFFLRLSGMGVFLGKTQAVLWAGLETAPQLHALKDAVDTSLAAFAGISAEKKRYAPHITLARAKKSGRENLMAFSEAHSGSVREEFPVESFALFRSVLTPGGALYTVLERFSLR